MTKEANNVFADLGLENAEELQAKAELLSQLQSLIAQLPDAGRVLGIDKKQLRALVKGKLSQFSMEQLDGYVGQLLVHWNEVHTAVALEDHENMIDMLDSKCALCKKGKYKEATMYDWMEGTLTCSKCFLKIDRYRLKDAPARK